MGVEGQRVPLLVLFADREQLDLRALDPEQLVAEDRAHVTELEQVLRAGVRVGPGIEQDGTPSRAGIGTAIAGRMTPGIRRRWSSPAASTAPVFPAETTASASPAPTARTAATRLESGLARTASAGLSAISIRSGASTSGKPCVSSPAGP